jgi:malonyl-CoA O-methyltransferase
MSTVDPSENLRRVTTAIQPIALARQFQRLTAMSQPAWLSEEIGRRLADKMSVMRMQPQHWLDWCAWLGAGSEAVAACYPKAKRWVWEPTPALAEKSKLSIAQAHAKGAFWQRAWGAIRHEQIVTHGDQPLPPHWPEKGVDLLWANMALHASENLPETMQRWHAAMVPQGFLMCSGLGPDTAKELKSLYQQLQWPVPAAAFLDMHDVGDALVSAGFSEPVMDMEHLTLTWPTAQRMLDELRTWGGNVAMGRMSGCRTPRWRERLLDQMTAHLRQPDGRLALTVEVVYGHAIKPFPRVPVASETKISLGDMRQLIKRGPPDHELKARK